MADDGADPVRESLKWMAEQRMEAEVSDTHRGPSSAGDQRTGPLTETATDPGGWHTRAGELELAIPKLRRRSYLPSFLQPIMRAERALVAVVLEAYVAGVSTRKVDQVVESLCLRVSEVRSFAHLSGARRTTSPPI